MDLLERGLFIRIIDWPRKSKMHITVIGTGYVGLVSGVCLASKGHNVSCIDVRPEVVLSLNQGVPHIHERGLPELLRESLQKGTFKASENLNEALSDSELVLVAVGTPSNCGKIDLGMISQVARDIGKYLRTNDRFLSVVIKSSVIPGTTDGLILQTLEETSGKKLGDFGLGMNPEFLREGDAIADFLFPDRIIMGAEDEKTRKLLEEAYSPWSCDKISVNCRTAEFMKYSNNCLLATQISAVNELANMAFALGGVDIMEVMHGVHLDKRWNPIREDGTRVGPQILSYLIPGCGFGGSCLPKDVQALRTQGLEIGSPMRILQAVLDINEEQAGQVVSIIRKEIGALREKRILVLGVAFKPGTDDIRESPSRRIIGDLQAVGCHVLAHDPLALGMAKRCWSEVSFDGVDDWKAALPACDGVVIVTKWPEYQALSEEPHVKHLEGKFLMDPRRMFSPASFRKSRYLAIGRRIP